MLTVAPAFVFSEKPGPPCRPPAVKHHRPFGRFHPYALPHSSPLGRLGPAIGD